MKPIGLIMTMLALGASSSAFAQTTPVATAPAGEVPPPLEIGVDAPDFALTGATRYGVLKEQIKLSDYRGKTVVLAFFPRARTQGCTIQMRAYRDQYSELLRGGRDIVLIAISADTPEIQAAWAKEEEFPFVFASDTDLAIAKQFGALRSASAANTNRNLFVVGPDGKIAYRATPFREIDPTAYTELGEALIRIAPPTTAMAQ